MAGVEFVAPHARMIVMNIGVLATAGGVGPLRGAALGAIIETRNAAIAIDDGGVIVAVGSEPAVRAMVTINDDTNLVDAQGGLVTPGLVDCHAHPVFGGDRSDEFELRNTGADYETLHREGGGIKRTVALTRAAIDDGSIDAVVAQHFDWLLAAGTTTSEAKSGYGLTIEHELAMLRVARRVGTGHHLNIRTTVLAAHTISGEYADRGADAYLDEVAIPAALAAADGQLATAADVFLERGSFDADQARRYLGAAQGAGLAARMHGDQFTDSGAVNLALEIGARSIDHLEALEVDAPRLSALAASDTTAVLLPLSSLFLSRPYAPGRALVDAGALVAVGSDFNPGSSYGESLTLAMSLACVGCGLTTSEAFTAVTANAAHVLGVGDEAGRIAPGLSGDLVIFDQPDVRHLAYHVGSPAVRAVIVGGVVVA